MTRQSGLFTFAAPIPPAPPQTKRERRSRTRSAKKRIYAEGRKVKVLRHKSGRYIFVVLYGDTPLYVSTEQFPKRGDAKAAAKAFMRGLPDDWVVRRGGPEVYRGYCYHCLGKGKVVLAARHRNGHTASMCRKCYDERHPGLLEKWEDVE